jgi:hypothetical protein
MGRRSIIAVVGVLVALASGAAAWAASGPPSGPDPAVEEWPEWPYLTTCGYSLAFDPVAAFSGTTEAEKGSRPSEVALREALERDEIPYNRSDTHWRLLAEDDDEAEFVHGRLSGWLEWVSFQLEEGAWKWRRSSSDCQPTSIVGRGPVVTWDLAESKKPNDVVRRIKIRLGPGECDGGRPQNPRARLAFKKWGRKLLMTVWLKPLPPGAYTCPGLIEPPKMVTLPRKIKLHRLWDGSTYPPRPAIKPTR